MCPFHLLKVELSSLMCEFLISSSVVAVCLLRGIFLALFSVSLPRERHCKEHREGMNGKRSLLDSGSIRDW